MTHPLPSTRSRYSHWGALFYPREGTAVCLWPFPQYCSDPFPTPPSVCRARARPYTRVGNFPNPAHPITKKH